MKYVLILSLHMLVFLFVGAQSNNTYQTLIAKASLFHLQENYKSAIRLYEEAFKIQEPDALTAYKAAGMYSLDSNAEKAFQYLKHALSAGWTEADWLSFDPYFNYLKKAYPDRWKSIQKQAFTKEEKFAKQLTMPALRKEINAMTLNDQQLRYQRVQHYNDSSAITIDEQINQSDLSNLNRAKALIEKYGWLTVSQIGRDGQNNLWLIVQHADQDLRFQQRALAAMKKLKGSNQSNWEHYAFLYDRIQCNLNCRQLYGTQVVWTTNGEASAFRPMEKEYQADERRHKLGLLPLQIYALTYGFNYRPVTAKESARKEIVYIQQVKLLIDSAKIFYRAKAYSQTYDYYNTASTFLGGMCNADNWEAAIIFSSIAKVSDDEKYRNIALDFLDLLTLRNYLTKDKLVKEPAFKILHTTQRWLNLIRG